MGVRLLVLALACLALGGSASAGIYAPPPGDQFPAWAPDGSLLYQAGTDADSLHAVRADGSGDRRVAPLGRYSRFGASPKGMRIAYTGFEAGMYRLFLLDGDRRDLGPANASSVPAWSRDGSRIAFTRPDGVAVADAAAGAAAVLAAAPVAEPAWSPDGRHLAVVGQAGLQLVAVEGGSIATLATAAECCFGPPAWSADGSRIAVLERAEGRYRILLARADGSGSTPLPLPVLTGAVFVDPALVWAPDGRSLIYATNSRTYSLYRLDLATGSITRLLHIGERSIIGSSGGSLALSPDGTRLAFHLGGECRDRLGIYVVGLDGRGLRRLTNSCRIAGTDGADRLAGTELADVLAGLAGDDRLEAVDPGYVGDTLEGGAGNDTLVGGYRQDTLDGGPGIDRLFGGPSGDLVIGGPGRDAIAAQGGLDVVDAFDGRRDTVSCGTNGRTTKPERDIAYVDRFDRVSRDCEIVRRSKRVS